MKKAKAKGGSAKADTVDRSVRDWYKDAVIYQVHVKAYQDSTNDGIGDFKGLGLARGADGLLRQ